MTAVNRFALSVLSRSNKAQSVNGEMMMDKETGQLLVKTPSGDIISYDNIARLKSHINDVSLLAQTEGIRGAIIQIEFENLELPSKITENVNLLTAPLTIKASKPYRYLFSIDVDTIETGTEGLIGQEPTVTVDVQYTLGEVNTNKTITGSLSSVNTQVINAFDHFPSGTNLDGHSLKVTSIKINKNSGYSTKPLRHILHSVLVII